MQSKRSFEQGSCEAFATRGSDKRLVVDPHQQSHVPRLRFLKHGSETREIAPSLSSGLSAPAPATGKGTEQLVSYDKKVVDPTKGTKRRKLVMRPPKAVRNAILVGMGLNGLSEPMYFNDQSRKDPSFKPYKDSRPPKILDNAERRLLLEIIRMDDEVGFQDDEGARESAEDAIEDMVGVGIAQSIKATQFDKLVTPSTCERDGEKISSICSSQTNRVQSNSSFHLVGGSSYAGETNYDYKSDLCRDKVRKVLDLFKDTLQKLQLEQKLKPKGQGKAGMKLYINAAMQLKKRHSWVNVNKTLGAVPGVEIGDHFHWRAELVIIGLHGKFIAGIDYMKIDGKLLATSIIASGRYGDKNESSDVLTYLGEGGNHVFSSDKPEDQKLVRGNLALKNSKDEEAPVRVIRGCQNIMKESEFIYDGLYLVSDCRKEVGPCGKLVYRFQLNRMQGQKKLIRWDTMNGSRKSNKASYGPIVVDDISQGKEKVPIRVVNAIDSGTPPPFKYTTKMVYEQCIFSVPSVCDCVNDCLEDVQCSCVMKNNCEVSLNDSFSIAEKKPIVYECGPDCKCLPYCKNRVSQRGIQLQLEVFKTKSMKWGLRSRNFISAGTFICEYVGELLRYQQKEKRIDFDESVFDTGTYYGDQVYQDYPNLQLSSSRDVDDAENVKCGNVGRFIRHSCSPNLYAKCVLFDHEDKSRPHVMLFAAKNIPPRTELTFDYKLW